MIGTLTVSGLATFNGGVAVVGTLTVSGTTSLGALNVSGALAVSGAAVFGGTVVIGATAALDKAMFYDTSAGTVAQVTVAALTTVAVPVSGDWLLLHRASDDQLVKASWGSLPGAGSGITAVVQDLTPSLGGNLNVNSFNITSTGAIFTMAASTWQMFAAPGANDFHLDLFPGATGQKAYIDFHATTTTGVDYDARIECSLGSTAGAGTGTLIITAGSLTINGTLNVSGASNFGAVTISGTLGVSGAATFGSTVNIVGTLTVTGATTLGGTLAVSGIATFNAAGGTVFADLGTRLQRVLVYTTTGGVWSRPASFVTGQSFLIVEIQAGGGGGGSANTNAAMGGGGGGGGYAWKKIGYTSAQLGTTENVTLGTGGAGGSTSGAGTIGVSGGSSSFGTTSFMTACGGAGGTTGGTLTFVVGGVGGATTSGDFGINGQPGGPAGAMAAVVSGGAVLSGGKHAGGGGHSFMGRGGQPWFAAASGQTRSGDTGVGYGAGGNGGMGVSGTSACGGPGTGGWVRIWEFA
jgi:hypothetical protein